MPQPDVSEDALKQLKSELDNFEDIAKYVIPQPGEVPRVARRCPRHALVHLRIPCRFKEKLAMKEGRIGAAAMAVPSKFATGNLPVGIPAQDRGQKSARVATIGLDSRIASCGV